MKVKKTGRKIKVLQYCKAIRTENKVTIENFKIMLIKNNIIDSDCFLCYKFCGTYKGMTKDGLPLDRDRHCFGRRKGKNLCIHFKSLNGS